MLSKICGIKDPTTLDYLINHKYPPQFIGFICNYKKSKRYIKFNNLVKLVNVNKKGIFFVAVLVNPDESFLEKIKGLNFDYYQLYNVSPERTKIIKNKYNKKIISALTINKKSDVNKYISYKNFSDIILFDGKGYEKSLGFDHSFLNKVPNSINKMIAGNIKYNENLDKYLKIADIIDVSGSLETQGEKDILKIDTFLKKIKKT